MLSPEDLKVRYGRPVSPAINPYTDIPIPDDVYVEEQYEDILKQVDYMLPLLEPYEFDNSTAAGRLRGELMWLKQEVEAKTFPIPGTRDMVATLGYLAFNYSLPSELPDLRRPLKNIVSLVTCSGLVKARHYPRVIELLVQSIDYLDNIMSEDKKLIDSERQNLSGLKGEMKILARQFYNETVVLPLSKEKWPVYWDRLTRSDVNDRYDDYYKLETKLDGPLDSKWRLRQSQPTPGWEMPDWVKEPLED